MSAARVVVIGLGAGGPDSLTLGALRRLRAAQDESVPIFVRTLRHPTVSWLQTEGIVLTQSFDDLYEHRSDFESVYAEIAQALIGTAKQAGELLYVVPGDPSLGERSVSRLRQAAFAEAVTLEVIGGASFVEPVLAAAGVETAALRIVDALAVPDVTDLHRIEPSPFSPQSVHVVYQIHDRYVATCVKLALLEQYPAEFVLTLVQAAGVPGSERVQHPPLYRLDHASYAFDHLTSLVVPVLSSEPLVNEFVALLNIMARLRDPNTGCPWDREQTPQTLKKYVIEEAYEVIDAIESGDDLKVVEEFGDLLLQVVFHAQLARERGEFTIDDVIRAITEKLIRRHPHVFGDVDVADSAEVLRNWEAIKRGEVGYEDRTSRLDGVPNHLPALMRAQEISKRAAKAGFEWDDIHGVFAKLDEELAEFREALSGEDRTRIADELGDLLFTVVNLARFAKIDAEEALRTMIARFSRRFRIMETAAGDFRRPMEQLTITELESLWQAAKREERMHENDQLNDEYV